MKKKCLTSLVIRDMQTKTPVRYYYTSTRMGTNFFFSWKITNVGVDAKILEHLCIAAGTVKWCRHCAKQFDGSSIS